MKNLKEFATEEHPLRSSQLPLLMACSWRSVMLYLNEFTDEVGAAADSGSAVHKAAETLHRHNKSYDDCITEAKAHTDLYPKVDWDEVRLYFQPYYADPRNHPPIARFKAIEEHFKIQFPNPEGAEEIVIMGTYDQIRIVNDGFGKDEDYLYDLKTGKTLSLWDTLLHHTLQLSCYWLGSTLKNHNVKKVGVIYAYGYRQRNAELPSPNGVFAPHPLENVEQCKILMKGIFRTVNQIRRGEIDVIPGYCCSKCPARMPSVCLPIFEEHFPLLIK